MPPKGHKNALQIELIVYMPIIPVTKNIMVIPESKTKMSGMIRRSCQDQDKSARTVSSQEQENYGKNVSHVNYKAYI